MRALRRFANGSPGLGFWSLSGGKLCQYKPRHGRQPPALRGLRSTRSGSRCRLRGQCLCAVRGAERVSRHVRCVAGSAFHRRVVCAGACACRASGAIGFETAGGCVGIAQGVGAPAVQDASASGCTCRVGWKLGGFGHRLGLLFRFLLVVNGSSAIRRCVFLGMDCRVGRRAHSTSRPDRCCSCTVLHKPPSGSGVLCGHKVGELP